MRSDMLLVRLNLIDINTNLMHQIQTISEPMIKQEPCSPEVAGSPSNASSTPTFVHHFHELFGALWSSLQKSMDLDIVLRWARVVIQTALYNVSPLFALHFMAANISWGSGLV